MNTHDFPQPKSVIYLARTFFLFGLLLLLLAGAPAAAHASAPEDGFNPGADNDVRAIAIQPDGKILVAGAFTSIGGESHERIARLNADGSVDSTFNASFQWGCGGARVWAIAVQPDGKILVGGSCGYVNGAVSYFGRLNPNGTLDSSFNAHISLDVYEAIVYAILVQPDGKILVGGLFDSVNGNRVNNIARLNADGTFDNSFYTWADHDQVETYALAQQSDGKILVGGEFTSYNGISRDHFARVNADGSLDTTFAIGANGTVSVITVQPNGKILLGGSFTRVGDVAASHFARVLSDGALDAAFTPNPNDDVRTMALQADGKIIIGGRFTSLNGQTRHQIARLNADGTLDGGINASANDDVWGVALQSDGKVILGGDFTTLGGVTHNRIARIANDTTASQTLSLNSDGSMITWLRGGASPEVWGVTFEIAYDEVNYTKLGDGLRISGGWELPVNLDREDSPSIRARGYYSGGELNGSASIVETNLHISATSVQITSSENPALYGDWIDIIATVHSVHSSSGTPTGHIQLWDVTADPNNPQPIPGCETPPMNYGQVYCWTPDLTPGLHLLTATYSGDVNHVPSTTDPPFEQLVSVGTRACNGTPTAPTLLSPNHRAREKELRVMLDWTAVSCAKFYQVVIHRDSRKDKPVEQKIVSNVSVLKTKKLEAGHSYFWRVRACEFSDATFCSKWSAWREFRIKANVGE